MRKIVIIVLICIALPVYLWDAWIIISGMYGTAQESSNLEITPKQIDQDFSFAGLRIVYFAEKGKSPFVPFKEKPKPVVNISELQKQKVMRKPAEDIKPPRITITGIMWNPSNPIAMLTLPDGSSTTAKAGQTIAGSIIIKKVEQNQILIEYEGNKFTIRK